MAAEAKWYKQMDFVYMHVVDTDVGTDSFWNGNGTLGAVKPTPTSS